MTRTLVACLVLTMAGALGCGDDVTEVVVTADSDLAVPDEIDLVRFDVDATGIGGQTTTRRIALNEGGTVLPVRLTVVHDEGPLGPVDVTATGMREGSDVVSRTARFHFIRGESLVLHLDLLARCLDESCPEGMTCGEDGCRDVDVDPGELREDDAGMASPDAGSSASDAGTPGTDSGPPGTDAGPPDAGPMCPETCMCEATCTTEMATCDCRDACACDFDCPPGADCEKIKCDHDGTTCSIVGENASDILDFKCNNGASCTVNARGVSNFEGTCDHGADCDVDCTGASNCALECKNGARCTLDCASTSNCEITGCDEDKLESCGDVLACNVDLCD